MIQSSATATWPGYVYALNCAGASAQQTADANTMVQAAAQNPGYATAHLAVGSFMQTDNVHAANYFARGLYVFLYENPQAYTNGLGSDAGTVVSKSWGAISKLDAATGLPKHIAVFRFNDAGTPNPSIANSTAYQIASAFDLLEGYVTKGGIPTYPLQRITASSSFHDQTTHDWTLVNALPNCGGSSGIFAGRIDPSQSPAFYYICTGTNGETGSASDGRGTALNTGFTGLSNQQVMAKILPLIFQSDATLWSAEYGNVQNPTSPYYYYLGQGFYCSTRYQNIIANYGRNPTAADYSGTACPTAMLKPTYCIRVFQGISGNRPEGLYGEGSVFECGTTQATGIAQALNHLGQLGQPNASTTSIAKTLISSRSYVLVFPTTLSYQTAFQAEGGLDFDNAAGIQNAGGTTWHFSPSTYSAIIQSPSGLGRTFSGLEMLETTDHELGHAVDIAFNYVQSPSALFYKATENDFLMMDFTTVGSCLATSTRKLPCGSTQVDGYTGPFVGVTDTSTGAAFCNGRTLNNPSGVYTGLLNHQILRRFTGGQISRFTPSGPIGDLNYTGGWGENYAQSFRAEAFRDTGGTGTTPVVDGTLGNEYLACSSGSAGYLQQIYVGAQTVTVLPAGCTSAIPAWFTTILMQANP